MTSEAWSGVCDLCGRPTDAEHPQAAIDLEVFTHSSTYDATFCCQEHAAHWLAQPLPPSEKNREHGPAAGTIADKALSVVMIGCLLSVPALWGLGCFTLIRWIWT